MAANALIFKDAELARDAISVAQKKEIENLYSKWADEIADKAKYYKNKTSPSSAVSSMQMKQLYSQIKEAGKAVSNEVYSTIKQNMYLVSDGVVKTNNAWLSTLGMETKEVNAAFSMVNDSVVRNIATGQIYDSGWSLSKRIWSDNEATLKDIHTVMASGIAQNKSIYDISKDLEGYVRPDAKLSWNLKMADGAKIYKKSVDYNAQRLARTLTQHSYQQSFIATTQKNPFITDYIWVSNGSRVCPICKARDGQHFKKDELPMDHPNGMCTMVPDVSETMVNDLADWFNSPDGTFPDIDEFAGNFGYKANAVGNMDDFLKKYGTSTKTQASWYNGLSKAGQAEAKIMKEQSGLKWTDWYEKNIYSGDGENIAKASKKVKAFTTAQDKYLKPYGYTTNDMPANFDEWSHKLSHDKGTEILKAMGTDWNDSHPFQQIMKYYDNNLVESKFVAKVATKAVKSTAAATNEGVPDYTSWISKMKKQRESEMLAKEEEWMKILEGSPKQGIQQYTGSSYGDMNSYLRHLQSGLSEDDAVAKSGINDYKLKSIKSAINGLDKVRLDKDYVFRRGTDIGDIAGSFMEGDFKANKSILYDLSADELDEKFKGAIGNYGAFTSTSSIWDRGFSGNVEVIFYAPKGTSASSIMSISNFGTGEGETLLNANTTVRCIKVEASDGHKGSDLRVFMEILTNN